MQIPNAAPFLMLGFTPTERLMEVTETKEGSLKAEDGEDSPVYILWSIP